MATRRRSRRSRSRPRLTPEIVGDDELLGLATDAVMLADVKLVRMSLGVRRAQRALLDLLGPSAGAYLLVEERTNERLERLCTVLVRWAFNEGLKAGHRR